MRRTFPLASLLLMGTAVAHGADAPSPAGPFKVEGELAEFMMGKTEQLVKPYIVGGQDARPGEFPYTTLMFSRTGSLCTSSLIAPGWVLGAAHCFFGSAIGDTGTVTIGTNLLTIVPRPDSWEVPSYVPYPHAGFNGLSYLDDIALLQISAYSKYPPVRLQTPALASLTEPGTPVTASGWGATQANSNAAPYLQWVDLAVQPNAVCENLYQFYDSATQLCESAKPKDTCQGDSGGPSVAVDPVTGWPYQVGITSYGDVCATQAGAVYTRVSAYWDWIRQTSGLSLKYYDVAVNGNGFIRATDNTPSTGSNDPGYVTPAASVAKGPKMHFNKSSDSWSVSSMLPDRAALLSQVYSNGFDIALYGVFPATYDRVLDSLHYTPEECKPAKKGRSIKCFDGTSTVTFSVRGSSGNAKISVKANGRDIQLAGASHLKAYLWLKNGDNYLMYSTRCKAGAAKMDC